jgi:two-component system LytT family response regulator
MPERAIRIAVVEDETLARQSLVRVLRGIDWVDVVGEAENGPSAVHLLEATTPDLALMDIRLPGFGALDVLDRLASPPAVIFVTGYNQHAVAAFALAAIDYVLKPFDHERLLIALERGREAVLARSASSVRGQADRARRALDAAAPLETIFVRDRGAIVAVPVGEIVRFEADDVYVAIIARGRRFLAQMALADVEQRLRPDAFLRVHRAHLVNLRFVTRFVPHEGGRFVVELADGSRVLASRRYSRSIRDLVLRAPSPSATRA